MIAQLRADMPSLLRQVYWAGFSNPCSSVFQPFYLHGVSIPEEYGSGTSTYSENSPWWQANRVKLLCDLNHRVACRRVRESFDPTERWELDRQKTVEAEAGKLLAEGKEAQAAALLQQFVDENGQRIAKEYRALNQTLPAILKTAGVEFLFTDYLRSWTAQSRVPLPLP